jgi:hypothetical protein
MPTFKQIENKHRNDCLFSFDDLDSSKFLSIFVDDYQQEKEEVLDEDAEFAQECEAIFGE